MKTITVFGTGCRKCLTTEQRAREAIAALGVEASVEHVREPLEIAKRGILFTPALAIDGEVVASGTVPSVEQVKGWLKG